MDGLGHPTRRLLLYHPQISAYRDPKPRRHKASYSTLSQGSFIAFVRDANKTFRNCSLEAAQ